MSQCVPGATISAFLKMGHQSIHFGIPTQSDFFHSVNYLHM